MKESPKRVVLENQFKNISHEANYVVDRIHDITKKNQKMLMRLLLRYCLCIQEITGTERCFSE